MKSLQFPKAFSFFAVLLIIPSLLLNIYFLVKKPSLSRGVPVMEVLDGDTILLEGKVRLRLRQLDAPELENCGGKEARDMLTSLVKGRSVRIENEVLDQYGRPMALIFVGNSLINKVMLDSGWVRYHSDSTPYTPELKEVADRVKKEEKGIFSSQCLEKENIANPSCRIKGNIDKSTKVKKYYLPGCAQYEFTIIEKDIGESWFCSEKEARDAGYTKADTCKQ